MDFILELQLIKGKSVIIRVVNCSSKIVHLGKLYGFPRSIVYNQDKVITNKFYQELNGRNDIKLAMTSTYHPQLDGQDESPVKLVAGNFNPKTTLDLCYDVSDKVATGNLSGSSQEETGPVEGLCLMGFYVGLTNYLILI